MSDTHDDASGYTPPAVWTWTPGHGGRFANINRPIAGPTHEQALPVGKHPLQLYSLGTPNGVKVTIMLEELLALEHAGAEYDAWLIRIQEGQQFSSGFVAVNPNSKIPALLDCSSEKPIRVFESGSILLYLAEKFGALVPTDPARRAECLSWLFWQMGSAPYLGGGFGHFYAYAPVKIEYAIDRFAMEVKREMDVLDKRLAQSRFIAGDDYTIADIAIWPWVRNLVERYKAGDLVGYAEFTEVQRVVALRDALPETVHVVYIETTEELANFVTAEVRAGDVVMVKSSLGIGFGKIVSALLDKHPAFSDTERQF